MVDDVAEFYSKNVSNQNEQYSRENVSEDFLKIRDKFMEEVDGTKVLDVGCGPGYDTNYFVENGFSAFGIDIAEGMIQFAKENNEGEFQQMTAKSLDFQDSSFDGIWCVASIFFMPKQDIIKALNEFKRVLKSSGTLYIDFKQGYGEHIKKKWGASVKEWHFQKEEIEEMLEREGLSIIELYQNKSGTGNQFIDIFAKPKQS